MNRKLSLSITSVPQVGRNALSHFTSNASDIPEGKILAYAINSAKIFSRTSSFLVTKSVMVGEGCWIVEFSNSYFPDKTALLSINIAGDTLAYTFTGLDTRDTVTIVIVLDIHTEDTISKQVFEDNVTVWVDDYIKRIQFVQAVKATKSINGIGLTQATLTAVLPNGRTLYSRDMTYPTDSDEQTVKRIESYIDAVVRNEVRKILTNHMLLSATLEF